MKRIFKKLLLNSNNTKQLTNIAPNLTYYISQISEHHPVNIAVFYCDTLVGEKVYFYRNELRHRGIRGLFIDAAAKGIGERLTKGIPGHEMRTVNNMVSIIKAAADYGDAHSREIADLIRSLLTDSIDYGCFIVKKGNRRVSFVTIRVDLNKVADATPPKGVFYCCHSVEELMYLKNENNGHDFYITRIDKF